MLLADPKSWRRHRPWAIGVVIISLGAASAYAVDCFRAGQLLGGSSLPGLLCGSAAAIIIVYEFLFVLRKWKGPWVWHPNKAEVRLRRHIWLGLLSFPLVIIHSGLLTRGSPLSVAVLVVFLVVIASGVWGLAMQQWLPRRLLEDVRDETVFSQLPDLVNQLRIEARLVILAVCGPSQPDSSQVPWELKKNMNLVRAERAGKGAGLLASLPKEPIADMEPLRVYFEAVIAPFLRNKLPYASPLRGRNRAAENFRDLRQRINPAAHATVDILEDLCERRRQLERQSRLHFWLHNWLWVHLPLSVSLVILLSWHVLTAILYW